MLWTCRDFSFHSYRGGALQTSPSLLDLWVQLDGPDGGTGACWNEYRGGNLTFPCRRSPSKGLAAMTRCELESTRTSNGSARKQQWAISVMRKRRNRTPCFFFVSSHGHAVELAKRVSYRRQQITFRVEGFGVLLAVDFKDAALIPPTTPLPPPPRSSSWFPTGSPWSENTTISVLTWGIGVRSRPTYVNMCLMNSRKTKIGKDSKDYLFESSNIRKHVFDEFKEHERRQKKSTFFCLWKKTSRSCLTYDFNAHKCTYHCIVIIWIGRWTPRNSFRLCYIQ